jgi:hypothetical protein
MLVEEHINSYTKLLPYVQGPMLMLGNQQNCLRNTTPWELFGLTAEQYTTLDPDGGDLLNDLTADCVDLYDRWPTVFNLGTLEHIWDAHTAWVTACRMVTVGGHLITHSPVGGYEKHGVHITDAGMIGQFLEINGFEVQCKWLTAQDGGRRTTVSRGGGQRILWLVAKKAKAVTQFQAPSQIFTNGHK